jgi:hypothetical protein
MNLRKDKSLDQLADVGNVAQFVGFEPTDKGPRQTYLRIRHCAPNALFGDPANAIAAVIAQSSARSVNIRSYAPDSPRSREFVYGLTDPAEVLETVRRLAREGLYSIVNETVDVADGGVSGVIQNGVIEFAPDDTPRCVEKPGVASLPLALGLDLLECIYGFRPETGDLGGRIEFSIHPSQQGWRSSHTLLWEHEATIEEAGTPRLGWPNRFSRLIGDKLYGLLMAHLAGLPVPTTQAIVRRLAPFRFGAATGSSEWWIRTCPTEQEPGLFTTHRGWLDPYRLLAHEDPDGTRIASVLAQASVAAVYSGASIVDAENRTIVEGVAGFGDRFMLGDHRRDALPPVVVEAVRAAGERLAEIFGPVRTEWVHDGRKVWIVQLHRGATVSSMSVLVPGERARWIGFEVTRGLEELRSLLATIDDDAGVHLVGDVGMTSHVADLVRKSGVPTRIVAG